MGKVRRTAFGHLQIGKELIVDEERLLFVDHIRKIFLDDRSVQLLVSLPIDLIEEPLPVRPIAFVMPQIKQIVGRTFGRQADAQVAEQLS